MRPRTALLLALLAPLAAGCSAPATPPADAAPAQPEPEPARYELVAAREPAPPTLDASLRLADVWLRPVQDQTATLDAPGATRVRWYVGIQGIHPGVQFVNGRPYVTAEPGPASQHPATTGALAAGASAMVPLREPGRHLFGILGVPEASLVVVVAPDAAQADGSVFLVEEDEGPRFLPERVTLRPSGRLVVRNEAPGVWEAARSAFQPWIGAGADPLGLVPVDEGMYVVVAEVADDAGARGEARARFLVDFDKPATRREVATMEGDFLGDAAPPGRAEADQVAFEAEHPMPLLQVAANVTTWAPGDASIRMSVLREGELLAEGVATREGAVLALHNLPPGPYEVRVAPEAGALLDYSVQIVLRYRFPAPPELQED